MEKRKKRGDRPPWWFMPTVFLGLGSAAALAALLMPEAG